MECQVETSPDHPQLTVGDKFAVVCQGPWPESFTSGKVELRLEEADKYKLNLLQYSDGKLLVTSYRPGEHELKQVQLVDNDSSVVLSDLKFTVGSVLDRSNPNPKPFGPMGPFVFAWPLIIWLFLAGIVLLITSPFAIRYWRYRQRLALLADLRIKESALRPGQQFFQVIRKLRRKAELSGSDFTEVVVALDHSLRVYLARSLAVPALQWSDKVILKDIRRRHHSVFENLGEAIKKCLAELEHAKSAQELSLRDMLQLLGLCQKLVEEMER